MKIFSLVLITMALLPTQAISGPMTQEKVGKVKKIRGSYASLVIRYDAKEIKSSSILRSRLKMVLPRMSAYRAIKNTIAQAFLSTQVILLPTFPRLSSCSIPGAS